MSEKNESRTQAIRGYVDGKIQWLWGLPENQRRAELAKLRRGIGHAPGELPELWGGLLQGMPASFYGTNGPSHEEWAVYLVKVIVAAGSGLFLNVLTDPFLGYFRNVFIFGQEYTVAQALSKIAGGVTLVNSVASTVCVVILYLALRPALERAKLLTKGENK